MDGVVRSRDVRRSFSGSCDDGLRDEEVSMRNRICQYKEIDWLRARMMHRDAIQVADSNWEGVLERAAWEAARDRRDRGKKPDYLGQINRICDTHGFEPEGAILGSTGELLLPNVSFPDHLVACGLLRDSGRIQQMDQGRGRALVVWSDLPIAYDELDSIDPIPWWKESDPVFVMRPATEEERIALGLAE